MTLTLQEHHIAKESDALVLRSSAPGILNSKGGAFGNIVLMTDIMWVNMDF